MLGVALAALGPAEWAYFWVRTWNRGTILLLRAICGIRVEIRGREYIPDGPALVAAKHQCMFDAFTPYSQLARPCVVTKQELAKLPFIAWYMKRGGLILVVDRDGHSKALRQMLELGRTALAEGRQLFIFPEGTRSLPGSPPDYKPGVAALYGQLDTPCVPMATNVGAHWVAGQILRRPGVVVFEYLPPIPPGLKRAEFMQLLQSRIEGATNALLESGV